MFIKASQKQRKGASNANKGAFHRHLARGRAWRSRLFLCSSVALAVSASAWLFDLSLTLHLAVLCVGFLAGFAWPLGKSEPWALAWIDDQAGLSYRTALERAEQEQTEHEGDPYGFEQALQAQADTTTKRLEPPTGQPWWLPLLAVALSLAVLPALSFPGLGGLGGGGAGRGAPSANSEAPAEQSAEAADPTAPETDAPTPGAAAQQTPELERTFDAPGEDTAPGEGASNEGQSADSETLERYLESLEAQDAEPNQDSQQNTGTQADGDSGAQQSGAQRNPFARSGAQQNEQAGTQSEGQRGGAGAQQGQEGQQGQDDQPGQRSQAGEPSAEAQRQAESQGSQGENSQAQQEQSETQAGEEGGERGTAESPESSQRTQENETGAGNAEGPPSQQEAQGEEAQAPVPSDENGSQEGQEQAGGASQGDPSSPQNPTQGETAGGSPSSQAGEQSGDGAERGAANGAGERSSAPTPSSAERLRAPQTGPERLDGQRGAGVTNRAGETLAPGSDDVNIPGERNAAEYQRAAEEAINEGRIPVEYQTILRDYFR